MKKIIKTSLILLTVFSTLLSTISCKIEDTPDTPIDKEDYVKISSFTEFFKPGCIYQEEMINNSEEIYNDGNNIYKYYSYSNNITNLDFSEVEEINSNTLLIASEKSYSGKITAKEKIAYDYLLRQYNEDGNYDIESNPDKFEFTYTYKTENLLPANQRPYIAILSYLSKFDDTEEFKTTEYSVKVSKDFSKMIVTVTCNIKNDYQTIDTDNEFLVSSYQYVYTKIANELEVLNKGADLVFEPGATYIEEDYIKTKMTSGIGEKWSYFVKTEINKYEITILENKIEKKTLSKEYEIVYENNDPLFLDTNQSLNANNQDEQFTYDYDNNKITSKLINLPAATTQDLNIFLRDFNRTDIDENGTLIKYTYNFKENDNHSKIIITYTEYYDRDVNDNDDRDISISTKKAVFTRIK